MSIVRQRLVAHKVKDDAGNVLSTNSYGATNERVMTEEGGARTYYVGGGATIGESSPYHLRASVLAESAIIGRR